MIFVSFFQAETEELAKKVECLFAENVALKSEVSKLTEGSEELRLENATLVVGPSHCCESLRVEFNSRYIYRSKNFSGKTGKGAVGKERRGNTEQARREQFLAH